MDSIISKSTKEVYYLKDKELLESKSKNIENQRMCDFDYSTFNFQSNIEAKLSIPKHFSKKIKNNNILNKLLYGNRLKMLVVFKPWENESEFVFMIVMFDRDGGKEYRAVFNKSTYMLIDYCEIPFII